MPAARRFLARASGYGQDKRERFARAGLRRGNHVVSRQGRLDGLGLYGGWLE